MGIGEVGDCLRVFFLRIGKGLGDGRFVYMVGFFSGKGVEWGWFWCFSIFARVGWVAFKEVFRGFFQMSVFWVLSVA